MDVIFVHDHIFVEHNGKYYSEGKITQKAWERFSPSPTRRITVIARSRQPKNEAEISRLSLSSADYVSFACISSYGDLLTFSNFIKVLRLVRFSHYRVVRLPSFLGLLVGFISLLLKKHYGCEVVGHAKESLRHSSSFFGKVIAFPFSFLTATLIYNAKVSVYVTMSFLQMGYPSSGLSFAASNVELSYKDVPRHIVSGDVKSGPVKLGFVGSLSNKYKGLDFLIEALSSLNFEFELEIVGSGVLKSFYEELSKNIPTVRFLGSLKSGEEMTNWMSSLDVYIHPSLTEGLPRSLIEAMSLGLPCVATNVGGIPELLPSEYLVPPNDSEAIAVTLNRMVSSEDELELASSLNLARSSFYQKARLDLVRKKAWGSYIKI